MIFVVVNTVSSEIDIYSSLIGFEVYQLELSLPHHWNVSITAIGSDQCFTPPDTLLSVSRK